VVPVMLLVPLYATITKESLSSLILTAILCILLVLNKQHLFKCKSLWSKLSLILGGVAISWSFSINVEVGNKSKPSTEAILEVDLEGNAEVQGGQSLVAAKVIRTAKANEHYIGKTVMLKFRDKKDLKFKSKKFIVKGILTNKKEPYLLINVDKYNKKLNESLIYKKILKFQDKFFYEINNISKLNQEAKSFLIAMTTGNKSYFENREISLFLRTGTVHLFAVSGLHFGIIYLILKMFLNFIIKSKIFKSIFILILLYGYLIFINESISATRAFFMVSLWEIVSLVKKKSSALSIISLAFLFSYLLNSQSIFKVGFQLSFSIVLAIIWVFDTNEDKGSSYILNQIYLAAKASFASFSSSVIIILLTFKHFVPIAIFSNILFVPLAFPIMIICLIYCLFFFIFGLDYPWLLNISYRISCEILNLLDFDYLFLNNIYINSTKEIFLFLPSIIIIIYNIKFNFLSKSLIIVFVQIFTLLFVKFIN
jgi:competence protein ComEC